MRVDDLSADIVSVLKALPFVESVERTGALKPAHRIIHLRDWHFVPKELADLDVGEPFDQQNLRVEIVQEENKAILMCLARHHGLGDVLIEGLTPSMLPQLEFQVSNLQLMKKVEDLGAEKEDRDEIRMLRLEMGAAVRLLAAGELKRVLPLEWEKELKAARPVRHGKIAEDPVKNAAREAVMVEMSKAYGPVAVIILGGKHRLAGPGVEVIRVTTKEYPVD